MVLLLSFSLQILIIAFIKFYRLLISPLLRPHCRFTPTCSLYGIEAICKFGIIIGVWLVVKRVLKCNPLHPGGNDPVPSKLLSTREY